MPEGLAQKLPALKQLSEATSQDLFVSEALKRLGPLVQQAERLAAQYDAVVANPPYMGSGGMNGPLKKFAKDNFPEWKTDLFACFVQRGCILAKDSGRNAMITMHSWMFLSSFEKMRERMLRETSIQTMAHLGARAFGSISGEVVQTTSFVLMNQPLPGYQTAFFGLLEGAEDEKRRRLVLGDNRIDAAAAGPGGFSKILGSPIAYWVTRPFLAHYEDLTPVSSIALPRVGCQTSDNGRFLRLWHEVSQLTCSFAAGTKWWPYYKGGTFRRWSGNEDLVINWEDDGREVIGLATELYKSPTRTVKNQAYYFREGITWSTLSSDLLSFRQMPSGGIFDTKGSACFSESAEDSELALGLLNSKVAQSFISLTSPTLDYSTSSVGNIPLAIPSAKGLSTAALVRMGKLDWDAYERSWDFQSLPLLTASPDPTPTLESSYTAWITQNQGTIAEMKRLEEENNRLFIDAYGLADELTPDVPIEQITLTVNPAYRYGGKLTDEEQWTRFRQDTMEELLSYAIGCMMGRYSLDTPGLIYAHSGNEGFDALVEEGQYTTFPADDDGIVPLTDTEWFEDDACNRVIEFLAKAWPAGDLEDNLTFLADNLSPKKNESSRDTIRSYINDKFFKDHLQSYKKRPIYWLFSSGKQDAFQCLVYLHRYNEGTLSRMRSEYVIPLQGKMAARVEKLQGDVQAASSSAQVKRIEKELVKLEKQQAELLQFDEKLRHYADMKIGLDLDDGVKVNYGKFGDLLAEVKAVHGKKAKES